jgi:hypothetical protein
MSNYGLFQYEKHRLLDLWIVILAVLAVISFYFGFIVDKRPL